VAARLYQSDTVIKLTAEGGSTVVNYQGDLQVGGLIAGIGQRMIGGIAKMMLNQFLKKMSKNCNPVSRSEGRSAGVGEFMKPCAFEYFAPRSVQEAVNLLGSMRLRFWPGARVWCRS